jgi:hypothetical protein
MGSTEIEILKLCYIPNSFYGPLSKSFLSPIETWSLTLREQLISRTGAEENALT